MGLTELVNRVKNGTPVKDLVAQFKAAQTRIDPKDLTADAAWTDMVNGDWGLEDDFSVVDNAALLGDITPEQYQQIREATHGNPGIKR